MASATEGKYAGEFLAGNVDGAMTAITNDRVVVLSGQSLVPGDVVGKVNIAGVGRVATAGVTGTGTGTCTLITAGPLAQVGTYTLTCTTAATHGGTFTMVAPDGTTVGVFAMTAGSTTATAFKSPHLNFTLTDATDFIVGDYFPIIVGSTAPTVLGGTGTGTISSITAGKLTQRGTYRLVCVAAGATHGGTFQGFAPDGSMFGTFIMPDTSTTATAFTSDHLNFTLTDATNFIVGNSFEVAVYGPATANPKVVKWDPTAVDGRQHVAGIAWDTYDASAADVTGVIVARGPVAVNGDELSWISTANAGDKVFGKQRLTALGIVVR